MQDFYFDYKNGVLKNKLGITDKDVFSSAQADFSILRTRELLENKNAKISIEYFRYIHYHMFQDLFGWAGMYRKVNIEKYEYALGGLSVKYGDYNNIERKLVEIFSELSQNDISRLNDEEKINYITDIMVKIWECHPFRDGNTRTVILFACDYCKYLGMNINQNLLIDNCAYVRNALVAATFHDEELEVVPNKSYLLRIMRDMAGLKERSISR